jgi:L-alanine-DL-glutamate epimerase-like enolase superfamily enzyme
MAVPDRTTFENSCRPAALGGRQATDDVPLTKQRFPVVDGDITVPEEPGLGIELDEEIVAKYRVG